MPPVETNIATKDSPEILVLKEPMEDPPMEDLLETEHDQRNERPAAKTKNP